MLPLPPEDDPDTFVRAHSFSEVEEYIRENEADFINFKSNVVLKDAQNDPIKRTAAITDVVKSIALIPDEIARMVYAKECSNLFGFDEQTILRQIKQYRGKYREQWRKEREQQQARESRLQQAADSAGNSPDTETLPPPPPFLPDDIPYNDQTSVSDRQQSDALADNIAVQEREVIRLVVNYGMCYLTDTEYDDGSVHHSTVLEHINNELFLDQMSFTDPLYKRTFEIAKQYIEPYYKDFATFIDGLKGRIDEFIRSEMAKDDDNDLNALDSAALINAQERKEKQIMAKANVMANKETQEFSSTYLQRILCSIDDDEVRQLACDLATDNMPQLSKIHTQFAVIVDERDKLLTLVPERLYNWKNALLVQKINETKNQIAKADPEQVPHLMKYLQELYKLRHELAEVLGDRVVNPN